MADARTLLRQQRAARRIDHPYASYSETGKLTCTLCHEPVKSDSLWDHHIRSVGHRQRSHPKSNSPNARPKANTSGENLKPSMDTPSDEALLAQIIGGVAGGAAGHKRKHQDESDEEMSDVAAQEDAMRKKRSKQDITSPTTMSVNTDANGSSKDVLATAIAEKGSSDKGKEKNASHKKTSTTLTPPNPPPPGLVRRTSGTPSHGVEVHIPSRPATPNANSASAGSTPKAPPLGRSPLIPQDAQIPPRPSSSGKLPPRASFVNHNTTFHAAAVEEEDDWAAFEAEVVKAPPKATAASTPATKARPAATSSLDGAYPEGAVITAAPMTAEEVKAKSEEEGRAKRRELADIELEDEKEEAKRALETEFEEMEELEARVRKLKEKREALRRGSSAPAAVPPVSGTGATNPEPLQAKGVDGKENINDAGVGDKADDEDDEEDEDDDWDGFRFHA